MNRLIIFSALSIGMSFMTCQETKEDVKNPISEKEIYRTIGEQIPYETGMEWISYYQNQKSEQGRTDLLSSYNISSDKVRDMMQGTSDLVGIAFHYAKDEIGGTHILVIPVGESLSLWESRAGKIIVDANTGNEITQDVASAWAQTYKNAHPSSVWFHFFGKNIFDEMCALPFFNSIDIEPAINILNLTPQMLLVIWNDGIISLGRTQDSPAVVYDASNACPPCAPR
jgi:hypothetical protein